MEPFDILFAITVYRDGTIRIDGKGRHHELPEILRIIADKLEAGDIPLSESSWD